MADTQQQTLVEFLTSENTPLLPHRPSPSTPNEVLIHVYDMVCGEQSTALVFAHAWDAALHVRHSGMTPGVKSRSQAGIITFTGVGWARITPAQKCSAKVRPAVCST